MIRRDAEKILRHKNIADIRGRNLTRQKIEIIIQCEQYFATRSSKQVDARLFDNKLAREFATQPLSDSTQQIEFLATK
jgi:hypothetical protein